MHMKGGVGFYTLAAKLAAVTLICRASERRGLVEDQSTDFHGFDVNFWVWAAGGK